MARIRTVKPGELRYKKRAIPCSVRRDVAVKYGCPPGGDVIVPCHYCGAPDTIHWPRLYGGRPGAWVAFGHEMDHAVPEFHGGSSTADNIVLACRPCNRSKGAKR